VAVLVVSTAFRIAGSSPVELDVDDGADDLHETAGGAVQVRRRSLRSAP
jgi:hypothetical protein